jgi:membrane-associated phospholipid phosphatase
VAVSRAASHEIDGAGIVGALATAAIGAIQPAAGKHYILDTVAGGAIGYAVEAVVSAAFDHLEPAVERWWEERAR